MAAGQHPQPKRRDAVLPAREPAVCADVLEHDQPPARSQHAPCLGERAVGIRDGAQRARVDDGVEARVGVGQRFRGRTGQLDRRADLIELGGHPPAHRRIRLRGDHARRPAEVRQARPRARPDIKDLAFDVGEQGGSARAQHLALERSVDVVVDGRE